MEIIALLLAIASDAPPAALEETRLPPPAVEATTETPAEDRRTEALPAPPPNAPG